MARYCITFADDDQYTVDADNWVAASKKAVAARRDAKPDAPFAYIKEVDPVGPCDDIIIVR
jgi:hypothetical protein